MTRKRWAIQGLLLVLCLGAGRVPAFGGDSIYGTVTELKTPELVVLDYGNGRYEVRIFGFDAPKEGPFAQQAREFVSKLVLGKRVQMRLEGFLDNGQVLARLLTTDPEIGIKDVGLEIVRAGLARRIPGYDYKYKELSAAEREAQEAKRGIWGQP